MKVSNCCGVSGKVEINLAFNWGGRTYEQSELCPKCGEHCEYVDEETQKTALMELIEWVNSFEYVLHKKDVITKATELLQKERDAITLAYFDGVSAGINQDKKEIISPSKYFEKNYLHD